MHKCGSPSRKGTGSQLAFRRRPTSGTVCGTLLVAFCTKKRAQRGQLWQKGTKGHKDQPPGQPKSGAPKAPPSSHGAEQIGAQRSSLQMAPRHRCRLYKA